MPEAPMEPIFQDPPQTSLGDQEWQSTVEKLIAKTGVWALIADESYLDGSQDVERLIGRIRASRGVWAGHSWEAMQRTMGRTRTLEQRQEARVHVYARHLTAQDGGEG